MISFFKIVNKIIWCHKLSGFYIILMLFKIYVHYQFSKIGISKEHSFINKIGFNEFYHTGFFFICEYSLMRGLWSNKTSNSGPFCIVCTNLRLFFEELKILYGAQKSCHNDMVFRILWTINLHIFHCDLCNSRFCEKT